MYATHRNIHIYVELTMGGIDYAKQIIWNSYIIK